MVGCMKLTWPFKETGIEYCNVRTAWTPVSRCVNLVKSASMSLLAVSTVVSTVSQSPAGEALEDVRLLAESHSLTAASVSDEGATRAST